MQTIRYMGSKRRLTNHIQTFVSENLNLVNNKYVIDLFAGTNTVAQLFKTISPVITNDVQEYSCQIALALIKNKFLIVNDSTLKYLIKRISFRQKKALNVFEKYVKEENAALFSGNYEKYLKFISSFPYYGSTKTDHKLSPYFSNDAVMEYKKKHKYLLFTAYFSNTYFSLNQSIQIDSIRYGIDKAVKNTKVEDRKIVKAILLTCLLSSLSIAVNSTSHFAQFHKLSKEKFDWILERRQKDIVQIFFSKIQEFNMEFVPTLFDNICLCDNYRNILSNRSDLLENTQLVYIDPPYSCAPYSRFYHVLETAVKYDYPSAEYDAKYRSDRYVSGFNRKGQVRQEFQFLFEKLIGFNCHVLFSYPQINDLNFNAVDLIEMCKNYYGNKNVIIKNIPHKRQGFGNINAKNGQVEYLILCK
ncbi:MAG: DNA adenine methylase [Ignavibacteriales bacterium]|nr:DNA adenine methylase [Ignavibacteriales bacterium]